MTLHATREGDEITVHYTYGSGQFQVREHAGHASAFWGQLGWLLAQDPAHREARARNVYNRYREHANGKAVGGSPIPVWDMATEAVREHWRHAVSDVP
jgi:hypothetical protein